jgi:hypothetical protein
MVQKPSSAAELMEIMVSAIQLGSPLKISQDALNAFSANNIDRFEEMFPKWTPEVHQALLRVATQHGLISTATSKLVHPKSTEVSFDDFVKAGKHVRSMTLENISELIQDRAIRARARSLDEPMPPVTPLGPWCDWPPLP